MAEQVYQEQVDKFRVEFSRGTTGGKMGFGVRAVGADKGQVIADALELAEEALKKADSLMPEKEEKK